MDTENRNDYKIYPLTWEEIEKLSGKSFKVEDLPETIINTKKEERIVKVLKKGMRSL